MKRSSVGHMQCSIARSLDIVGEWWTPLIMRDVFRGMRRFEEIQGSLGIGRAVLSDRLGTLVEAGLLERRPYQDNPVRYEYRLTDMGRDFSSVLISLKQWGDRWLAEEDGPPVTLIHERCGHEVEPILTCSHCHEPILPTEIRSPGRLGADPDDL
ncbi:MAG: helix-turn-helix transcriptional regulator [Actinobacteria bacterium]|nr:helix-turn-helix transcriptional regulator [Actinomycetota bacterium]